MLTEAVGSVGTLRGCIRWALSAESPGRSVDIMVIAVFVISVRCEVRLIVGRARVYSRRKQQHRSESCRRENKQ
jgi:hypothetical protein